MRASIFPRPTGLYALTLVIVLLSGCSSSNDPEPATTSAPPIPELELAVMVTADPPPFDRPCKARSQVAWKRGDKVIRPVLHWDMEQSAGPERLTTAFAHSGRSSMLMGSDMEYGPSVCRTVGEVADTLVAVGMGFWMHCTDADPLLTVVTTVHRGEEQLAWYGKDLRAVDKHPGEWMRFNVRHPMNEVKLADQDRICCFLWNRNKSMFHVDDVDLVFQAPGVLGKRSGHGPDLERGEGAKALSFVTVTEVTLLDPGEQGIQAGKEAPPDDRSAITISALGGIRWSHGTGDAVARLSSPSGEELALVRAWHPTLRTDLLDHEQVMVVDGPQGPIITGFDIDVDSNSGKRTIAASPAPRSAMLHLTLPVR
jgi:hypothetical protein